MESDFDTQFNISSKKILSKADDLDEVFRMYIEDINPFIVRFEVESREFPAEILNEIRAVYGHIARVAMSETDEQVCRNIEKMKGHSKRALLDCFKYTSIMCSDEYESFMSRYGNVDMTFVDEGRFLSDVRSRYKSAKSALQHAKISETTNMPQEELFELYQNAYQQFEELCNVLKENEDKVIFLQCKAAKVDNRSKKSYIVGIAGLVVGIISIAIAVVTCVFH